VVGEAGIGVGVGEAVVGFGVPDKPHAATFAHSRHSMTAFATDRLECIPGLLSYQGLDDF
jgi:hypothetical protein